GLNGSLTIPSSITSIGNGAFYYCSSISSIKAYGTTPSSISLGGNVFKGISQSVCKLYVPVGTKTLYAAAAQWNVFTITEGFPPTITTQAVSSISSTTAIGNGNITDLGAPNPTAYGVCWNTDGTPTTSDSKVDNGAASVSGAFITSMTELSPNTTYYVRAYATNTAGTIYGEEVHFTTDLGTAVNSTKMTALSIYPNPATNIFTINAGDETTTVAVFDLSGSLVLAQQAKGKTYINISSLEQGVYLVKANGSVGRLLKK
ncbi:MAG: T9SS type A sorting domain-containing protein, partial [Bacteroidales bacterium]